MADLIVDNETTTLEDGSHTYDDVEIINGGLLQLESNNGIGIVEISCDNFTVDWESDVEGYECGYSSPGDGEKEYDGSEIGGGGGYGGRGGDGAHGGDGGSAFGTRAEDDISHGGNGAENGSGLACVGGMGFKVEASNDIVIDGRISVSAYGDCYGYAGGAGGGIYLYASTIKLSHFDSKLAAQGRSADGEDSWDYGAGGGAGGRIKVIAEDDIILGDNEEEDVVAVSGGVGYYANNVNPGEVGEDGTYVFKELNSKSFTLDLPFNFSKQKQSHLRDYSLDLSLPDDAINSKLKFCFSNALPLKTIFDTDPEFYWKEFFSFMPLDTSLEQYHPSSPSDLFVTQQDDSFKLFWNLSKGSTESYNIYKSEGEEEFSRVNSVDAGRDNFIDTTVIPQITYGYYITAESDGYESLPSNIASGRENLEQLEFNLTRDVLYPWQFLRKFQAYLDLNVSWRKQYTLPPFNLDQGAQMPDLSSEQNHGVISDTVSAVYANYDPDVYTEYEKLSLLLNDYGDLLGDYQIYSVNPYYSYVIFIEVDVKEFEKNDLRPKLEKLLRKLKVMHPAGKTAYIYIYAEDHSGLRENIVVDVMEEITGSGYFDDGGYFDDSGYFDEGQDLVHPSVQEYRETRYGNFDDGGDFDEGGPLEKVYPDYLDVNKRPDKFDDGGYLDDGGDFDTYTYYQNKDVAIPLFKTPDQPEDYSETRFDDLYSGVYYTIEYGKDV